MGKKVLLVEDEKNVILGVRTCLDAVGYDVEIAEDGEEGLNAVRREHPDLILLDLLLPKLDGFEVLKVLKSDLARVPAPLGFELLPLTPTGVLLKWGAAPERWQAPTKLSECALWLADWLREAGEPLAPQDIVAAAKGLGFSRATVFRAREALGTQIRNTAGRRDPHNLWAWQAEDEDVTT